MVNSFQSPVKMDLKYLIGIPVSKVDASHLTIPVKPDDPLLTPRPSMYTHSELCLSIGEVVQVVGISINIPCISDNVKCAHVCFAFRIIFSFIYSMYYNSLVYA